MNFYTHVLIAEDSLPLTKICIKNHVPTSPILKIFITTMSKKKLLSYVSNSQSATGVHFRIRILIELKYRR